LGLMAPLTLVVFKVYYLLVWAPIEAQENGIVMGS
jgi:hypothetical protein